MKVYNHKIMALVLAFALLQLAACQEKASTYEEIHASHMEHIEGSEFSKLELTQRAIERTDIKTSEVTEEMIAQSAPQLKKVVPYGALIYGPHGETWVYTNPEPHTYIRQEVTVESVKDGKVILSKGPPPGMKVVTQGAAELYGTEYAVGH